MTKEENYLQTYLPFAKVAGQRFGIDPLVILSQAALESGWGTSHLATQANNFFGFTASGTKNEFWKGDSLVGNNQYKLKFRKYATPADGFSDFARLISTKYKAAAAAGTDYKTYALRIANSPYISESNGDNRQSYMNNIISIYENILAVAKKKELLSQVA